MINVFNIERFATHDGDGIRTVVFLKGCPLHCPWCSNPESWNSQPQLIYDKKRCTGCRHCEMYSKNGAISFETNEFQFDGSDVENCRESIDNCPTGAIEIVGEAMSNQQLIELVLKDDDYYRNSGGGVTISGGEPFMQFNKLFPLLQDMKKAGLNVAVETTGNFEIDKLIQAEPYVDSFLYDIKHLNSNLLHKITGADNQLIMANLEYLANNCTNKIVLRAPVIPGFNYNEKYIQDVLKLAKQYGIKEVNFLPYHTLGKNKWEMIMKKYYSDQKMLNKKELEKYVIIGERMGLVVKIGG